MKTIKKVLFTLATVSAVLAPLVPKNIYININKESISNVESTSLIKSRCDLHSTSVTESGMQICEYHCREGNKATLYKTFRSNAVSCSDTITEKVQRGKK